MSLAFILRGVFALTNRLVSLYKQEHGKIPPHSHS